MAEPARILVVEDELTIREVLEDVLTGEGYDVRSVTHGREALEVLQAWPAEVVVLDLMLPVMDGWSFLQERQRAGIAPASRVLVLSASRQVRQTEAPHNLGVDAALPKPFDLEEVLTCITRLLEAE